MRRARRRKYKSFLPSSVMGNVRSLVNEMDKLGGAAEDTSGISGMQCCVFHCETCRQEHIPDSSSAVPGFQTDGDSRQSSKKKGGGTAVLVNNRWCDPAHVTVKELFCSPDIELLVVSLRPYHLQREFTCAIFVAVDFPPSAVADAACDITIRL